MAFVNQLLRRGARSGLVSLGLAAMLTVAAPAQAADTDQYGWATVVRARHYTELGHNVADLDIALTSGYTVRAGFLSYFDWMGGLDRWGYPTSEVFEESEGRLAQYFQRGVMDFRVETGVRPRPVWDELAARAGQGVAEPAPETPGDGIVLGPWGHTVSNVSADGEPVGFLDAFWQLGGVESLGYPKTEARRDTSAAGTLVLPGATPGFIRQYFQFAVMEHHPDALSPVRLALLGDQLRDQIYPERSWTALPAFRRAQVMGTGDLLNLVGATRLQPVGPSAESAVRFARPSLVHIETNVGSCASGFFVDHTGLFVTNWHAVEDALTVTATPLGGVGAPAQILAGDPTHDLALLQVDGVESTPVTWGRSDSQELGASLVALGFPETQADADIGGCPSVLIVTTGVLSGRVDIDGASFLQTDAALNPGVSGGAVVTLEGELVGIATAGVPALQNTNYLIPEARARPIVEQWLETLRAGGTLPLPHRDRGPVALGEEVTGTIAAGERDRWTLDATEGDLLRVETAGFDTVLSVFDPNGVSLGWDDDSGTAGGSAFILEVSTSGPHTIEVRGFGSSEGTYTLLVARAQVHDRGAVTPGSTVSGTIESGDRDRWTLEATAGTVVRLETAGFDTVLFLYDPDGGLVALDDDSGPGMGSAIVYEVETSGPHVIQVQGFWVDGGTYTLTVELAENRERGAVEPGQTVSGTIRAGDRERWTLEGEAGQTVTLETAGFDTTLALYDPNGDLLAEDDDSGVMGGSRIVLELPATGTYVVEVRGFGLSTGDYELTVG